MENYEIASNLLGSFHKFKRIVRGPSGFAGLKPSEMGLLFTIKHGCALDPEGMKVSELSTKMRVTSSSVTQLVTGVEEQGLVLRKMDKEDRRSVKVTLTPRGVEITEKAEQHLTEILTGLVEYLGPERSMDLVGILNDVFTYLSKNNM
jgi:DNA-binding MarR family transcriptional regulator